jgi:hypothetical protein
VKGRGVVKGWCAWALQSAFLSRPKLACAPSRIPDWPEEEGAVEGKIGMGWSKGAGKGVAGLKGGV